LTDILFIWSIWLYIWWFTSCIDYDRC